MSAAVFVLDVEEFRPLVVAARAMPGVKVEGPVQGYLRISAPHAIEFNRKALGFKPAVWYGAMTGGMQGQIVEFGRDILRIESAQAS